MRYHVSIITNYNSSEPRTVAEYSWESEILYTDATDLAENFLEKNNIDINAWVECYPALLHIKNLSTNEESYVIFEVVERPVWDLEEVSEDRLKLLRECYEWNCCNTKFRRIRVKSTGEVIEKPRQWSYPAQIIDDTACIKVTDSNGISLVYPISDLERFGSYVIRGEYIDD